MTTKWIFSCALVLAVLDVGLSHAQDASGRSVPYPGSSSMPGSLPKDPGMTGQPSPDLPAVAAADPSSKLSSWITYTRPDCCGPVGGSGVIRTELFARIGPSFNVGGGQLKDTLQTGLSESFGGRSLFFNPEGDRAWTIELSVQNISNHGQRADIPIPFNILLPNINATTANPPPVPATINITIRDMIRTSGNLTLGREWYFHQPINHQDINWRVGADMFAKLGTLKLEVHELEHRTDVYYGFGLSLHSDLEIPYGCCTFILGVRAEWAYNWIEILQPQNSPDLQEVNVLFNLGVRF